MARTNMSSELICPECGGVIGADSADVGRACSCWANKSASTELITESETSDDTVVERAESPKAKVCCQCGKDLNGQRRLRDSGGYWCYACHKLDKEANKPKGEKCAECGRVVAEAALSDYQGMQICGKCREEHKEQTRERRRLSPVQTTAHDVMARRRLYWMIGVVAVLLVIIILRSLRIIGT